MSSASPDAERSRAADDLDDLSAWMARPVTAESDAEMRRTRAIGRTVAGIFWIVVLLALAAGTGYTIWALSAPVPEPTIEAGAPAADPGPTAAMVRPTEGASVIAVRGASEYLGPEAAAEGMIVRTGSGEQQPIASITKLITALVVLEAHPLDGLDDPGPTLTFSEADHDLYDAYYVQGATVAGMPAGSRMSLRDALATMLIPSASNYADAVSTWAFGSSWGFREAAREWLDARGLTSTVVVDPTGLDPRNVSTPDDLMRLADIAADDAVVAHISGTPAVSFPGTGTVYTTNTLLGQSGISGLKTGNLGPGTFGLVYTATLDVAPDVTLDVTGVRLGAQSRDSLHTDIVRLLDSVEAGFHPVPVARAGQTVGTVSAPWGATAAVVIAEDAEIFTWSDTPIASRWDSVPVEVPRDGAAVGVITWSAGPETVSANVVVEGEIEPPSAWWRLMNPGELG
ncbi:serine hydrolase [Microbacterium chocolatum]|uniref:D-alanyl-D-alanine carboxypeptidase family protein n=1 Tax=Microbacterium aurantiacum TaxID=162393 RepID=UPI00338FA062